jgi:hypothetical protein
LQKRDLYESKTDREARLYKKRGAATSVLRYLGQVLSDGRHGLSAAACGRLRRGGLCRAPARWARRRT